MCTLISKYNVPGPRYTSYPTVPYWDTDNYTLDLWKSSVKQSFSESKDEGISLYIHLPFCESLCTFCGCTKRITKNHAVEIPYIDSLLRELEMYSDLFEGTPMIKQLHLGGGTPTFFAPKNLTYLLNGLFSIAKKAPGFEFSFEGHPNNTTREHLSTLYNQGFKRVCYGVQDYNPSVQKAIHRIQPFKNVEAATMSARDIGYESVGHDLVYGLPFQSEADVKKTICKTITLQPDRIAFYSYAHVPWIKGNAQRGFKDSDLPSASTKRKHYEIGKSMLLEAGYFEIGMDHFALKNDSLYKAQLSGTLHRNFMGYTEHKTQVMIGLGVSSISDSWYGFSQNVKSVEIYQDLVGKSMFPVLKGHLLNNEDLIIRQHILNLMCKFKTNWNSEGMYLEDVKDILIKLKPMEDDGLVILDDKGIKITEKGRPFVRNICLPFDLRLQRKKPETALFSMTV